MYPILITYIHTHDCGNELRYTLRSLKNITNFSGEVVVVGDTEDWFNNVEVVKTSRLSYKPYLDQVLKIHKALPHMPDTFIIGQDDIYCLEPVEIGVFHQGDFKFTSSSLHQRTKRFTHDLLVEKGYTPIDYETHTPMLVNKAKLQEVLEFIVSQPKREMLQWRSLYGNFNNVGGAFFEDKKVRGHHLIKGDIISTARFIPELKTLLPEPSEYEL
jgi:hypothetical protein